MLVSESRRAQDKDPIAIARAKDTLHPDRVETASDGPRVATATTCPPVLTQRKSKPAGASGTDRWNRTRIR
jgi:hypothetical protein